MKAVKTKLQEPEIKPEIVIGIMRILLEISLFTREVELRKMTAYLKYKYRIKERKINYSQEY
jgi:hypothetical protein